MTETYTESPDLPRSDITSPASQHTTAFDGHRRLASGTTLDSALAVKRAIEIGAAGPLLIFDDSSGRVIDIDTRGTDRDVAERLSSGPSAHDSSGEAAELDSGPRRRGRPTLGVVAREVTLLPRHWAWLNTQPGGASATIRRLIEHARRSGEAEDRVRRAREAAYRFAHAIAGDLPGFEEASRALFAGDRARFTTIVADWPRDVGEHALALAFPEPHDPQ